MESESLLQSQKSIESEASVASSTGMNSVPSATEHIYSKLETGLDFLFSNKFIEAEEFFAKTKDTSPRNALHFGEVFVDFIFYHSNHLNPLFIHNIDAL